MALNLTKPSEAKDEEEEKNRENKIRKTDDATKSLPCTSQSIINVLKEEKKQQDKSNQDASSSSAVDLTQRSNSGNQKPVEEDEKMVVSSPEPPIAEEEDDEDPGEIHIVSLAQSLKFVQYSLGLYCVLFQ